MIVINQDEYKIKDVGSHRAFYKGEDTGIRLFKFTLLDESVYFECHFHFAENGNDFRVFIRNFGIRHATLAGSTTPTIQMKFGPTEAQAIKHAIVDYFENTPPNTHPFSSKKGKLIGVDFENGWIATKENHKPG